MKTLFTLLTICLALPLMATDEGFFLRQSEKAHPTPDPEVMKNYAAPVYKIPYKVQSESKFFNVATTVNEENVEGIPTQNESSIAVNPNNPNIVIASAVDYRDNSSTWVYISTDGGRTWENKNLGKANGWRSSNDPSVMFDKDGIGYLVHGAFPASGDGQNGVYINISTDGGLTWGDHIPVIEHKLPDDPLELFEDKYYIEVDNSDDSPYRGHLYIPWKRVTAADSATQIVMAKSTDQGQTWLDPVNISERLSGSSEDTTFGQSFPLISTGPEGNVYAVWNHGIEHAVGFNKSTDGGSTWGEPRLIHKYNIFGTTKLLTQGWRHTLKGKVRAEAYPVIKTDYSNGPNRGNVYVVWAADSVPNIYFSKSTDQGETWSEAKIVHSVVKNDQFWTWLGVDPINGDLAVMYLDSRNDPDNILVECFVSYSSDGGETWTERQISDEPSDIRNNPFSNNVFAGDYSGLDFYDGVIFPSWVDMRNTVGEGGSISDNDVYSAIIRVDQPSPVNNFTVNIIPSDPRQLQLDWETVWESSFGRQLNQNDFTLELYRDDVLLEELSPNTESYTDNGLTPFQRYDYKLRAVSENDSSIYRFDYNYAGGSEKPDSVSITNFEFINNGDDIDTKLFVKIPATRADKTTPITNVIKLEIFADGEKIRDFPLVNDEIGTTVAVNITEELNGFGHVSTVLVTGYEFSGIAKGDEIEEIELQYSDTSKTVFVYEGKILNDETVSIDFEDNDKDYYSMEWAKTDEAASSEPNSLVSSPGGYESNSEYMLYFTPSIYLVSQSMPPIVTSHELQFDHIALVNRADSAIVETSSDLKEWTIERTYTKETFEQWGDNEFSQEDWINEEFFLYGDGINSEFVFVRLRLKSNSIINDKGWYIDNINLVPKVVASVEEEIVNEINIYPNPTSNYLNVSNTEGLPIDIKIIDLNGNIILSNTDYIDNSLDLTNFASGIYIIQIKYKNITKIEKITIIK